MLGKKQTHHLLVVWSSEELTSVGKKSFLSVKGSFFAA